MNEKRNRIEPVVSYNTFAESNSEMKLLIEQLQARVEKAEAAARQSMEKLEARKESDSNRLLSESLARQYEERLARHVDVMPARLIDIDAPVNRVIDHSLVQRREKKCLNKKLNS